MWFTYYCGISVAKLCSTETNTAPCINQRTGHPMISQLPACRLDEHAVDDEVPGMVLVLEAEQSRAEQRGLVRHIHSSMAALHH